MFGFSYLTATLNKFVTEIFYFIYADGTVTMNGGTVNITPFGEYFNLT
jgi:hypothetical protein